MPQTLVLLEFYFSKTLPSDSPDDFSFGISVDFMQKVISQVGNYGEVYDRHLVPLGLTREGSLNALWTEGGLIYAPPFR